MNSGGRNKDKYSSNGRSNKREGATGTITEMAEGGYFSAIETIFRRAEGANI